MKDLFDRILLLKVPYGTLGLCYGAVHFSKNKICPCAVGKPTKNQKIPSFTSRYCSGFQENKPF